MVVAGGIAEGQFRPDLDPAPVRPGPGGRDAGLPPGQPAAAGPGRGARAPAAASTRCWPRPPPTRTTAADRTEEPTVLVSAQKIARSFVLARPGGPAPATGPARRGRARSSTRSSPGSRRAAATCASTRRSPRLTGPVRRQLADLDGRHRAALVAEADADPAIRTPIGLVWLADLGAGAADVGDRRGRRLAAPRRRSAAAGRGHRARRRRSATPSCAAWSCRRTTPCDGWPAAPSRTARAALRTGTRSPFAGADRRRGLHGDPRGRPGRPALPRLAERSERPGAPRGAVRSAHVSGGPEPAAGLAELVAGGEPATAAGRRARPRPADPERGGAGDRAVRRHRVEPGARAHRGRRPDRGGRRAARPARAAAERRPAGGGGARRGRGAPPPAGGAGRLDPDPDRRAARRLPGRADGPGDAGLRGPASSSRCWPRPASTAGRGRRRASACRRRSTAAPARSARR